jgi:hypothetical protein
MTDLIHVLSTTSQSDTSNVRIVKAIYSALKARDPTWDVTPGFPEGGIYKGMSGVFGSFYQKLLAQVHTFGAYPQAFLDSGDVVVALGYYRVRANEKDVPTLVRFAHVWGVDTDGRIKGVWQVADSACFPRP